MLASIRLLLLFFEDFLWKCFWNSWRFSWTITILVDVLHLSVLLVDIMNCLFLLLKIVAGLLIHSEWCLLHCLSFWRRFVLGLRWRCTFTFFLSNWGVYRSSKSDLRFIFGGWLLLNNRCPWPFPLPRIADICCYFTYGLLSCVLILLFCLLYDHIGELFSFIANAVPTLIVTRNVSSFTGNRWHEGHIIWIASQAWWPRITLKVLADTSVIQTRCYGVPQADRVWSLLTVLII